MPVVHPLLTSTQVLTQFIECHLVNFDCQKGRTVHVRVEGDLAIAYRQLDKILNQNKVRATLMMTERHEKPGVKRRRLSSQRWRKRFADEVRGPVTPCLPNVTLSSAQVRKKVQLVMKIRDRGA